ncbi:hypothetical protein HYY74_07955 [Candidatus Woesearchaeota archaeon]|nr:hypothetical protein [Candidatus Woesearchaeota archaeon]
MNIGEVLERFASIRKKYQKHAALAVVALLAVLFFGATIKPLVVSVIFILLAAFSTFYHNYFRSPINFELMKLFTIIESVAYGALAGVIVGVTSIILGRALSGRLDQETVTSIFAMSAIAVLAGMFRDANITVLGITLALAYYLILSPFIFLFRENKARTAIYIGTNLLFNAILFINIGPAVLSFVR